MTSISDLVAEHQKLKGQIAAGQTQFDNWAKPFKDRMAAIEAECHQQMLDNGIKSQKTDFGTAILSEISTARIKTDERDDYIDFCLNHWDEFGGQMLQIGAPKAEAVREYMEAHEGKLPPHVEISTILRFSIRKA